MNFYFYFIIFNLISTTAASTVLKFSSQFAETNQLPQQMEQLILQSFQ